MKKIKRSKIGIALILIAAMILTGCGGGVLYRFIGG